ncbi:MAG: hypothetical protein IH618_05920, partial [Ignavibacteriaceae bacterium]|nr:hypothetical protein [Ignavibacteriaceae bacterium]
MKYPESQKPKSLFKIILISFASLFTMMILFFAILFVLFLVYKDDISKTLLTSVNHKINGEITFSDLSFTPFRHFPNAAIVIENFSLKESKDSVENFNKLPVFDIDETYLTLHIIDLFLSKINVSEITFDGGSINVIVYPDSQTNLEKAIKIISEKTKISGEGTDSIFSKRREITEQPSNLELRIDKLEINDLIFIAYNQITNNKAQLQITELESRFSY